MAEERERRRCRIAKVAGAWWLVDRETSLCIRSETFLEAVAELDRWTRHWREVPC